jgi:DNA-binding MarR family transcriptional regulator
VGAALTEVILQAFRAHGMLLAAGGALAAEDDLTPARWQVLGALALAPVPLTVPQIARRMGLTRQSVHATVNRLATEGLVQFTHNDDHRRSMLVRLTEDGRARYAAIDRRQVAWSNQLADGMPLAELQATARTLGELCRRLTPTEEEQPE